MNAHDELENEGTHANCPRLPRRHDVPAQPAVHPLGAFIGAAISGVDLSAPLRPGVAEMIADAVTDHQVVFVRDQSLDERQLWRLAEQLARPRRASRRPPR
jgi:hypothetical protein